MWRVILSLGLFLLIASPVRAAGGELTYMQAITIPYSFEPIEIPDPPVSLEIDLVDTDFINNTGSMALTLFSILEDFSILGIFLVILLAVGAVFWLWTMVTETSSKVSLQLFDAAEIGADLYAARQNASLRQEIEVNERAMLEDGQSDFYLDQVKYRQQRISDNSRRATGFKKAARQLRQLRRLR